MPPKSASPGQLPPLYNFFLNPYIIERFKHCPQCDGITQPQKVPVAIHVDPDYPVCLNYTCRYCAKCDLLIVHKAEIESYLTQMFIKSAPRAIGSDYLVIGTCDLDFWERGTKTPIEMANLLENLHSFKQQLDFPRRHGQRFNKPASKPPVEGPTSSVDNVEEALKLLETMKANLPITARPTKELLKSLRKQGYPINDRRTLSIRSVLYGGDEMGIGCDITPPGQLKQALICSVTQLEILGDTPLTNEIRAYQQQRKANLARRPDSAPSSHVIKPKK